MTRVIDVGRAPMGLLFDGDDLPGLGKGRQQLSERGADCRQSAMQQNQRPTGAMDLVIHLETVHRSVPALGILAPFIRVLDGALCHADFPFLRMSMSLSYFTTGLLRKPLSSACLRLGSLFCAVPRWCVRLERTEKVAGDCCYLVNGSKECSFVGFRWLVEAAHLSHELQRGRTNLFLGHRRFEVEECFDVSTHKRSVLRNLPFCGQAIISIRFLLRRGEFH